MGKNLYLQVYESLTLGKRIVLARIIRCVGSAPRAVGSICIIMEDGTLVGTIGGGLLEHRVIKRAKDVFRDGLSFIYHFQLTGEDLSRAGMICGGTLDVYLEPLFPENMETVALFRAVKKLVMSGQKGALLTVVSEGISALDIRTRMLIMKDGCVKGEIPELQGKIAELSKVGKPGLVEFTQDGSVAFVESIEFDPVLLLFGAGHVSTFVAPLAKMVGFRVVVIDDRSEFANRERFPDADEIHVLLFPRAFEKIQVTESSYIVIVTRGHAFDKVVLESALKTEPAYVGMIGSTRKRNMIYKALIEEGISPEVLDRVSSPIGIEIDAETPEEIAVSIVAELIKTRAAKNMET